MTLTKQRGLSLIELMVSITLGLLLIAGVVSIFFSSKVTFMANQKTARLQESGRVALDFLVHDVRSAGYMGCARAVPFSSTLNDANTVLWNYAVPLQGFESTGSGYTPALDAGLLDPAPAEDSDVIVVRALRREARMMRVEADLTSLTAAPVVTDINPPPVEAGAIMMITDCNASSVFQLSAWNAGQLEHAAAGSEPGNSTDALGYMFQEGARVGPLETYVYYVAIDPVTGEPGLYCRTGATTPSELLIEGVQALQIAYGEDTDGDRIADQYVAADAVADWDRILSVTLSMLIRSEESAGGRDGNTYQILPDDLGGSSLGPYDDLRQRMVFTTTITLRNRAM